MFTDGVLETGHMGEVVDVALDASGKRLATASDDGSIHVYEADAQGGAASTASAGSGGPSHIPATAAADAGNRGTSSGSGGAAHDGSFSSTGPSWRLSCRIAPSTPAAAAGGVAHGAPVTCVAWAPLAYYGSALVACTEDAQVRLWSDFSGNKQYEPVYQYSLPSPGRCTAWAPEEYGKLFAVGCTSGVVAVFTGQDQTWDVQTFPAHHRGCLGLSFAPFFPPGALLMAPLEADIDKSAPPPPVPIAPPRMVTCGASKNVKVWVHSFTSPPPDGEAEDAAPESVWTPTELMTGPLNPESATVSYTKVAWAPSVGLPYTYIAAASEDGYVAVWSQDGPFRPDAPWQYAVLPQPMPDSVTNLSWSSTGTFLLVSCADGTACMWREASVGTWELVSEMENPAGASA